MNNLTFGLFFKDTQEVTINAADNSGTVFVSYLVTDRDLSEAELQSLVFGGYEEPFCIDPNGEYIVYAMLVDESLNITYLRSDRVTLDNIQPVIGGIEDGKTYCEAQTVTVDEKYVDKAGNTAEMTVTVNDGHTFGEWTSNGDGTHTRQCTVDGCNGSETNDCSGGKATCTEKAVCDLCGENYGETDSDGHSDLEHIDAKAATEDSEGNIEYWHCKVCGKYYADAEATKEITDADTVTKKLPPKTADTTPVKDASDTKAPGTGDGCVLMICIALMTVSTGTIIALLPKRKKSS